MSVSSPLSKVMSLACRNKLLLPDPNDLGVAYDDDDIHSSFVTGDTGGSRSDDSKKYLSTNKLGDDFGLDDGIVMIYGT